MGISKKSPGLYLIKARVKVQTDHGQEDRRKQELFKGNKSQAEERFLVLKALLRGEKPKARTFGDLLQEFAASRGGIPRAQESVFNNVVRDLGAVDLTGLEGALTQYGRLIRRIPSATTGKVLAGGTINRYRAIISATLNHAVELNIIVKSPLSRAVWAKAKETPRDRYLDALDIQRLFNVMETNAPYLIPITRFAMLVPCRKSELVRMSRHDLDLFHGAIRVHNGTTKNEDGTWKPIPEEMIAYFRSIPPESTFLFFRKEGNQYLPLGDFKRAWGSSLRLAGIHNFRFHDTRHISATNLVDAGTPERVVMAIAGWRTNMLSTYYKGHGKKTLSLVRFPTGRGNNGTVFEGQEAETNDLRAEKAVL